MLVGVVMVCPVRVRWFQCKGKSCEHQVQMLVGVVVVCPVRVWRLHCLGIKGDGEFRGRCWIDRWNGHDGGKSKSHLCRYGYWNILKWNIMRIFLTRA